MKKVCSFCGRTDKEVRLLITGLTGHICDDCAMQAYEIVQSTKAAGKQASADKFKVKKVPKPKDIKAHLDEYVIGQDDAKRFLSVSFLTS